MTRYSMSQVETITGIKSHTIRKWEQRYSFIKPNRTDTNIRYYSDDMLRKLLNVSVLLRNGYRVSAIDEMTDEEVNNRVNEIVIAAGHGPEDVINSLLVTTLDMKEADFEQIFRNQILRHGLLNTLVEVIYPFLNQVGVFWGTNKLIPAQEHFITNLIRHKLIAAIDMLPQPDEHARRILMFLPQDEYHDLGLLLSNYIARNLGYRVYYLGQNVPEENIRQAFQISQAHLLLTFVVAPRSGDEVAIMKNMVKETRAPLLFSGNPDNFHFDEVPAGMVQLSGPKDLIAYLEKMRDL